MPLRWLLRRAVHSAARAKAAEAVRHAATAVAHTDSAKQTPTHEQDPPCRAAVLFDLPVQLDAFVKRMQGVVVNRASGLDVHVGGLAGKQVAAAVRGEKPESSRQVIKLLVCGHRPDVIVAAGQGGGLVKSLGAGDIVVANELVNEQGERLTIDIQATPSKRVHVGCVASVTHMPSERNAKLELAAHTDALAADPVSFSFGEACRREGVPFMSIRVLSETLDDALPSDVAHLFSQKSIVGKVGAFTGSLWRRPGSVKDLWQLNERTFETSDRLAAFLASILA